MHTDTARSKVLSSYLNSSLGNAIAAQSSVLLLEAHVADLEQRLRESVALAARWEHESRNRLQVEDFDRVYAAVHAEDEEDSA